MKHTQHTRISRPLLAAATAAALITGGFAFAADASSIAPSGHLAGEHAGKSVDRPTRDGKRRGAARMFQHMDIDGDGTISREEFDTRTAARFAALDADGDSYITFDEFLTHRAARHEERARAHFDRIDSDGDGRISVDEMAAAAERRFDRMDRNGDGVITVDELRHARMGYKKQRGAG